MGGKVGEVLPFFVFPVSMLWILMHTLSTLWTGLHPFPLLRRSKQITPLE